MKRFRAGMWLILGAIIMLSVSGVPAHAAVIFIDDFNSENGGVANSSTLNYAGFDNWTVSDGTVDLIGNGYFDFYPTSGLYVDLDGSTGDAGVMTSKTSFSLGPGQYELKFFLGGNQRGSAADTVDVSVEVGWANASYILGSTDPLAEHTLSFNLAATTTPVNIVFDHAGGDNIGIILDNVRLISVPEPGTMALLGTGLFGLILGGRKKFRK